MNYSRIPSQHSVIIGGVVDDARVAWQKAEADFAAADLARAGNATDPILNQNANTLRNIALNLKKQFEIANAAEQEARRTPLRTIDLAKVRRLRDEAAGEPSLLKKAGTVALLVSPLAVAALLIRRMS